MLPIQMFCHCPCVSWDVRDPASALGEACPKIRLLGQLLEQLVCRLQACSVVRREALGMRGSSQGGHVLVQYWSSEPGQGQGSSPMGFLGTFNATDLCKGLKNTDTSSLPSCFSPPRGPSAGHTAPQALQGAGQGRTSHPRPRLLSQGASNLLSCSLRTAQSSVTSRDSANLHGEKNTG